MPTKVIDLAEYRRKKEGSGTGCVVRAEAHQWAMNRLAEKRIEKLDKDILDLFKPGTKE